jgi:hypothetical protein
VKNGFYLTGIKGNNLCKMKHMKEKCDVHITTFKFSIIK